LAKPYNGAVLYRGPSMLDGAPIIAIATGLAGKSRNTKTGALIHTWIIREDVSPNAAINSGDDASICGDCPHRGTIADGKNVDRSCYVLTYQAPLVVFKAYHRGIYPAAADLAAIGRGRRIRVGSYGDPAAVPFAIWEALTSECDGSTGYTHQWRRFPELAGLCMASCDTESDRIHAKVLGFRTFRVRSPGDPTMNREVICPASREANYKSSCAACLACGGHAAKARADIVIVAHGAASKRGAFARHAESLSA